jgi:hypothetical protein
MVKTRQFVESDIEIFGRWLYSNRELNRFYPDLFTYGSTRILATDNMYMPYHLVAVLESLAPNPSATHVQRAAAIKALVHDVAVTAEQLGVGEIWFTEDDPALIQSATRHGFELLDAKVLRIQTSKLLRK